MPSPRLPTFGATSFGPRHSDASATKAIGSDSGDGGKTDSGTLGNSAPHATTLDPPSPPRIMPVSRLLQGGRWRVEAMRSLSEPCLLWFTRGQGRITLGGLTRGYGPHNAIFIPAGVMHGFELGPQNHGSAVFFGRGTAMALPSQPLHLRIRDAAPQAELTGFIESALRELDGQRPARARAAELYLGLVGVWLERQMELAQNDAQGSDAARRLVARYTNLLERDFHLGQNVGHFADALGVTPTHLTRVCRSTCGRAALDLLQDRRLYEARRLLAETDQPVKDISDALGFTSPTYFARAFHARIGKTPSDFRKAG